MIMNLQKYQQNQDRVNVQMISNIVKKKIQSFNLQPPHKQILLARIHKSSAELNKRDEIFKICRLYIKDGQRFLSEKNTQIPIVIVALVQELLNQICLPDETYDWILLRVHYTCLKLRCLFADEGASASKKAKYITRISYFLKEIMVNSHYKKLKKDYYSHIQFCFFYAIKDAMNENKMKKAQFFIDECFGILKEQIQVLLELLEFQDKKVFMIIENKTQFLLKLYAIELTKTIMESDSLGENVILRKYSPVLNKVPNKTQPLQMENLVFSIFEQFYQKKQERQTSLDKSNFSDEEDDEISRVQSVIPLSVISQLLESERSAAIDKEKISMKEFLEVKDHNLEQAKNKSNLDLDLVNGSDVKEPEDKVEEISHKIFIEEVVRENVSRKKNEEKKSKSRNKKYSVIFQVALQKANQYETRVKRSLSQAEKEKKLAQYKDSQFPQLKNLMKKKGSFIIPKCVDKRLKL